MSIILLSSLLYPAWVDDLRRFLADCGIECPPAEESPGELLETASSVSCGEFCLPLKLFCARASAVAAMVSASETVRVLIPVVTGNSRGDSYLCHLQQRAFDIAINLELLPRARVVAPAFTYDDSMSLCEKGFWDMALELGIDAEATRRALDSRRERVGSRGASGSGAPPLAAANASQSGGHSRPTALRVAVTGNPPVTDDPLLGGKVRDMLRSLGAVPYVPLLSGFSLADYPKDIGHFSLDAYTRAQIDFALSDAECDGVVYLQAFLCGPGCGTAVDAGREKREKPFLPLVLDQNRSMGGIETRLEAFIDLALAKRTVAS